MGSDAVKASAGAERVPGFRVGVVSLGNITAVEFSRSRVNRARERGKARRRRTEAEY
jgi:hypothetical protein